MYLGSGFAVSVCAAIPRPSYPLIRLTVTSLFSCGLISIFIIFVGIGSIWSWMEIAVLESAAFTEFFIIVEFHPHQTFCLLTNICGLIFSVWGVDKNFAQLEERDKLLKCWRRLQYPAQREQWTPNILQNFSLDDSIKQKSTKP